jgi:aminodeoxyfutalosine synthase|tara:strand:+ start:1730 stop:2920 length:1191 start_codon:yes stop_codon:yes gene_type:complete
MAAGELADWRETLSKSLLAEIWPNEFHNVVHNLANGIPLSRDDGHILFASKNLDTIGRIANIVKYSRFKDDAYFNVNVHINQTNICTLACKFCAFRRGRKASDAYEMDIAEYIDDLRNYSEHVDEVHSVGGLHPDWDVEHYTKLFTAVKEEFPHIHIKALTAVEVKHVANLSNMTIKDTLNQLHQAGLDSLPGGGAEILDDEVRSIICRGKESSQEYLDIHRTAHELGIPTNCTMLFGTIETIDQRITHLLRLRELQSITRGFQCFVPYPFLPDDSRLPEAQLASGSEILRVIAISRLMLDNIPHIKAYRMNLGDEISELALQYGADDIDGTVQKESIMHLAGSTAPLDHDKAQLARLVVDAGAKPVQRNTIYTVFEKYIPPKEPETRSLLMAKGD